MKTNEVWSRVKNCHDNSFTLKKIYCFTFILHGVFLTFIALFVKCEAIDFSSLDSRHMKVTDLGLAKLIIGKTYTTCLARVDPTAQDLSMSCNHSDWVVRSGVEPPSTSHLKSFRVTLSTSNDADTDEWKWIRNGHQEPRAEPPLYLCRIYRPQELSTHGASWWQE